MHTTVPPPAPAVDFRTLLRRALAGPPATTPTIGTIASPRSEAFDRPAAAQPVAVHRREWLFALGASALASAAEADKADDLRGLIRERVAAALTLADAVRPAVLLDWVRGELFFGLPLDPAEGRRFLLAAADALSAAVHAGEILPDDEWAVIRRGSGPPDGSRDTAAPASAADTPTADAGRPPLHEQVTRLADLPDPRVAEWLLLSTACGQSAEELADWYDVPPADIASALHAARALLQSSPGSN